VEDGVGGLDLLPLMLSKLGVGVITTDAEGRVESLSPLAERLTGWTAGEARGRRIEQVFRLSHEATVLPGEPPPPALARGVSSPAGVDESLLLSRDGWRFAIEHTMTPIRDADGRIQRIVIVFNDVSQRNFALLQLTRHASHDSLTGLLNREAFAAQVGRALRRAHAEGASFAVCHIDLDQFNLVNNTCGHAAGDTLLQWVAAMLREECRETDVLARLGGDVFGVLMGNTGAAEAQSLAENLLARLARFQFSWEDKTFPVGACIGLVPVERGDRRVAEVLAVADHACAQAKGHGGKRIHICQIEGEEYARRQQELDWVARIRSNLREGKALLFAQPIRPLSKRAASGVYFEVLLRLAGDDGRPMSAASVIHAAERYGLMGTVDRWVIHNALSTLASQPREVLNRLRLCSINLSAVSLHDPTILEFIHQQLARSRVAPQRVCFELTETAAVANLPQARWLIQELLAIGCRFALDDFGSGIASYSYLKDLPVNYLKVAGGFVENIVGSALDTAMVESINQIARVLGVETIAESVSSQTAFQVVQEIGVDFAQGHWIGEPRPLQEVCGSA